jgi:hypothetical protein
MNMSKEEQTQGEQAQYSQSRNEKPWPRGDDEHTSQHHALTINVNAQCAIDAGNWQECVEEDQTPYRLVSPPHTTMYRQVLSYLEETTRNEKFPPTSQLHFGEVAIATAALCIRWGSYFAVLTNRDLPQWTASFDPEVSCIGDGEMARINIEASAALSGWLDLMRADQPRFRKLVKAAVQLLPFPITQLGGSTYYNRFRAFSAFNSANGRRSLLESFARGFGSEWLERERAHVLVNPTRALANGLLNEHWRNGSGIEDVHAGGIAPPRPLLQCRLTRAQEARLLQETAELFVPTMRALYHVIGKPSEESWPEQALPYAIAFKPPADWSLDEQSREITIPGAEPR